MIITLAAFQLKSLDPTGADANTLTYPDWWKFNRIGEYKKLALSFTTDVSIENKFLYFNPALFDIVGSALPFSIGIAPSSYYGYSLGAPAYPITAAMTPNATVPYANDLMKNYTVSVTFTDSKTFTITIKYFQLYDLKSFLNPAAEANRFKLTKDYSANGAVLNVAGSSVYTDDNSQPAFYLFIQDPFHPLDYGQLRYDFDSYKAGFYNKNEHQADPYFNTPVFALFKEDGATSIPSLNIADNNQVTFTINSPDNVLSRVYVWMIRTDTNDNTVDFITNYEATFIRVFPTAASPFGNKIIEPKVAPVGIGADNWKCSFHVDKTKIAVGQIYRFIAVCHKNGDFVDDYQVNSFISDEYIVGTIPFSGGSGDSPWDFGGLLLDTVSGYTGNELTCVVEERMKTFLGVDYGASGFSQDILARLGLTVPNDIRRYMTSVMVEVYEDTGSTRQYFDRQIMYKTSPTTYSAANGMTLTWVSTGIIINYAFRNRYETWLPNLQTRVGSTYLPLPTSNMNWAGRTILIETSLQLYYDDYIAPFTDVIHFTQKVKPSDYSELITIKNNDNSAIGKGDYWCGNPCFKSVLDAGVEKPEDYLFITTAEVEPGLSNTVEENEVWVPATSPYLLQKTSNKFLSQETAYEQTEAKSAKFCLDGTKFTENIFYKISNIAKRIS